MRDSRNVSISAGCRRSISTTLTFVGLLSGIVGLAPNSASSQGVNIPAVQNVNTSDRLAVCPSQNFQKFLHSFADSSVVQRSFTKLPLQHGRLDLTLENPEIVRKEISSFDQIPQYNKATGRIFNNESERRAKGLDLKVEAKVRTSVVTVFLPDTGFHVFFKFRKDPACWFLTEISDEST